MEVDLHNGFYKSQKSLHEGLEGCYKNDFFKIYDFLLS